MITWTPEAEQEVYDYLNEVSRLAASRGEDGAELQANLMEHIRNEVAERGLDLVTEDVAKQIVAQLGAPEDIVGEPVATAKPAATPPPVPPRVATPPPTKREGMRWFSPPGCLITLVIGLIIGFIVVPVTGILVAILLPAMMRARLAAELANQQHQVEQVLQQIVLCEEQFQSEGHIDRNKDGIGDFGTLEELNASETKKDQIPFEANGYVYHVIVIYGNGDTKPGYECTAKPLESNTHQTKQYYVDESRVIRYTKDGVTVPDKNAQPLGIVPKQGGFKPYQVV